MLCTCTAVRWTVTHARAVANLWAVCWRRRRTGYVGRRRRKITTANGTVWRTGLGANSWTRLRCLLGRRNLLNLLRLNSKSCFLEAIEVLELLEVYKTVLKNARLVRRHLVLGKFNLIGFRCVIGFWSCKRLVDESKYRLKSIKITLNQVPSY